MSGSRPARRARASLLVLVSLTALAVGCTPAPYEGIPETSAAPTSTASTSPESTTTTALAPTSVPETTITAPPEVSTTTRPAPATTATRPQGTVTLGTTGVRITLTEPWQVAPGVDPRPLLPAIAEPLAAVGFFAEPVLVATRRDAPGALTPSVMAFELPRGAAPSAAGTLATLREAIGRTVAASEPRPEPSRIGEGAYLTYQYAASVNGTTVEVVSEHYAFVRPTRMLVVTMTTTLDRANIDGHAFGAMLASLSLTG